MTQSLTAIAAQLATAPGATIGSFLKGLAAVDSSATKPVVTLPKEVAVSGDQRAALAELADAISTVAWPTSRRVLADDEQTELAEVLEKVKAAKAVVADAEAQLRVALFNHLDVTAEQFGAVGPDTPRDKSGFYLVAGEGKGFKREYRSGTPTADVETLQALVGEGLLDHTDFLKITRPTRVIDESKFLAFVAKRPEKLSVLRRAVKFARSASVSLKLS